MCLLQISCLPSYTYLGRITDCNPTITTSFSSIMEKSARLGTSEKRFNDAEEVSSEIFLAPDERLYWLTVRGLITYSGSLFTLGLRLTSL